MSPLRGAVSTPCALPLCPGFPLPQFCGQSSRNCYRRWSIWTCLLPHRSWNRDHKFQSGSHSLENKRVKKALKATLPPSLYGRESTSEHKIPGKGLKIQQFLWTWVPTFNRIPTRVEWFLSHCFSLRARSSHMYARDMKGAISAETKQASEREDTSQAVRTPRGTYGPGDCAWCPRRLRRGWNDSISFLRCLQGSGPCNHWSCREKNTGRNSEGGKCRNC